MGTCNSRLKAAIYSHYPTQADFAEVLGVCATILSQIIRGRRKGTAALEKISVYLGVDEQKLFPNVKKQGQQGIGTQGTQGTQET